ncbi:MAG: GNAT family N-acetyltransferase [Arachnia sp.]
MYQIDEFALPESPDAPEWHAYQELARGYHHEMIDGPGWDSSDAVSLDLARRAEGHTWTRRFLATVDGEAVGYANLRVNHRDEADAGNVSVYVAPAWRSRGIGRALADRLADAVREAGLVRLSAWVEAPLPKDDVVIPASGVGAAPADYPGVRMALALDFTLEQVERVSRYDFAAPLIDPEHAYEEARRAAGDDYEVIAFEGAAPEEVLADLAQLKERMTTDPPTGGMIVAQATWDAQRVREMEGDHLPTMRFWRALVRHRPTGTVVALSELMRERGNPDAFVDQWDTIVLPEHRGHRLGMLVKAVNLLQVRDADPDAQSVVTWNAEENRHMLDVNEALGFRPILVEGAFQRLLT